MSGGQNRHGFVSGSKLTWIVCDDVRPQYIYGVLTDKCVGYVLDDHSVTVNWVSPWFVFINEQKRSGLQIQYISGLPFINEQKGSGLQIPVRSD